MNVFNVEVVGSRKKVLLGEKGALLSVDAAVLTLRCRPGLTP